VVVVVGLVVVVRGLVVVTVLNSERSEREVQPGSLRSTLPSRSLSRPSEHCGLGAEVEVVDDTGSVDDVVVDSSPKGNLSGVLGEGITSGAWLAGGDSERVKTKIKKGTAATANSNKTFTMGVRSLNGIGA
jgi:hypothetical protein